MRAAPLLLALFALACTPPAARGPAAESASSTGKRRVLLFATGDVGSDTDVCGCKAHPLGGVARRAHLVRGTRADEAKLVLDAGDLFFRNWSLPARYEAQARETAFFHADYLRELGAPAIAVGERDLAFGLSFLRALEKRSGASLLSANLVHAGSGTVAFSRFLIVERGGIKLGLIAASPELLEAAPAYQVYKNAGLLARPVAPALEAAAKEARAAGAELVIGLLHIGQARALEILSAYPEGTIDLALVAHDRMPGPLQVIGGGKTALISVGERGKYLAEIELTLTPGARGFFDSGAIEEQKKQIAALDERLATYKSEDAGISDPTAAQRFASDRADTISRLAKRRVELEKELAGLDALKRNRVLGRMIEIEPTLTEDEVIAVLYKKYQSRLVEVNAGEAMPNRNDLAYVGAAACKTCHEKAYAQWQTTKHAKAWATMITTRQTGNLDCIGCHTTGFDRPGGPNRLVGLEPFINVGCESCHGPASAHVANPKLPLDYAKKIPEKVCAECHRAQADQKPFDFEERMPKILGKGHGR